MAEVTVIVAFIAGVLSFFSPCILPLVPAFFAYLGGLSGALDKANARMQTAINALFFVLGFAIVFTLLGVLLNSLLVSVTLAVELQTWLSRIGGAVIVFFGLFVLGIVRIPFLEREHKIAVRKTQYAYVTSLLFGASFAAGWTPCIGAVLGAVLTLAVTQPAAAVPMLLAYSLGLGMPFLLAGVFAGQFNALLQRHQGVLAYFNMVMGILLIALGILVFTQQLSSIAGLGFAESFMR